MAAGYEFAPLFELSEAEKQAQHERNRIINRENQKTPRNIRGEIPD